MKVYLRIKAFEIYKPIENGVYCLTEDGRIVEEKSDYSYFQGNLYGPLAQVWL